MNKSELNLQERYWEAKPVADHERQGREGKGEVSSGVGNRPVWLELRQGTEGRLDPMWSPRLRVVHCIWQVILSRC